MLFMRWTQFYILVSRPALLEFWLLVSQQALGPKP